MYRLLFGSNNPQISHVIESSKACQVEQVNYRGLRFIQCLLLERNIFIDFRKVTIAFELGFIRVNQIIEYWYWSILVRWTTQSFVRRSDRPGICRRT